MTSYQRKFEQMFEIQSKSDLSLREADQSEKTVSSIDIFGYSVPQPMADGLLPRIERMLGSIA